MGGKEKSSRIVNIKKIDFFITDFLFNSGKILRGALTSPSPLSSAAALYYLNYYSEWIISLVNE